NGVTSTNCGPDVINTYLSPGCYNVTLTVTSQYGCVSSTTIADAACVLSLPYPDFSVNPTIMSSIDPVADFTNNSANSVAYEWDFGDESAPSYDTHPTHEFETTGNIVVRLIAFSPDGCPDTIYQTVVVNEELIVYVPNTFTPDND